MKKTSFINTNSRRSIARVTLAILTASFIADSVVCTPMNVYAEEVDSSDYNPEVIEVDDYVDQVRYIDEADYPNDSEYINEADYPNDSEYINEADYTYDSEYINEADYTYDSEYINGADYTYDSEYINGADYPYDSEYINEADYPYDSDYIYETEYIVDSDYTEEAGYIDEYDFIQNVGYNDEYIYIDDAGEMNESEFSEDETLDNEIRMRAAEEELISDLGIEWIESPSVEFPETSTEEQTETSVEYDNYPKENWERMLDYDYKSLNPYKKEIDDMIDDPVSGGVAIVTKVITGKLNDTNEENYQVRKLASGMVTDAIETVVPEVMAISAAYATVKSVVEQIKNGKYEPGKSAWVLVSSVAPMGRTVKTTFKTIGKAFGFK